MERGAYETSRQLRDDEMVKRELAIQALGVVDMAYYVPEDPAELTICEGCE